MFNVSAPVHRESVVLPLTNNRPVRRLLVLVWYKQQGQDGGVPPVPHRPADTTRAGGGTGQEEGEGPVWPVQQQGSRGVKGEWL